MVECAVGCNTPQDVIAKALGVCVNTLKKHCASELAGGLAMLETRCSMNVMRIAMTQGHKSEFVANMAILNNRCGWRQAPGAGATLPITLNFNYAPSKGATAPAADGVRTNGAAGSNGHHTTH